MKCTEKQGVLNPLLFCAYVIIPKPQAKNLLNFLKNFSRQISRFIPAAACEFCVIFTKIVRQRGHFPVVFLMISFGGYSIWV